jgi:hypothetical protein
MKPEVALELLENTAAQLAVRVSYEPLQTSVMHGGLCKVKGQYRIIVDKRATAEERVITVATALATIVAARPADAPALELDPKAREILRQYEASSKHKRTAA